MLNLCNKTKTRCSAHCAPLRHMGRSPYYDIESAGRRRFRRAQALKLTRLSMSDYDRSANARYGAGVARSGVSAVDQGLRAYMIGVYNYMTLGLGVTGLVALGAFKLGVVEDAAGRIAGLTGFGHAIYASPLRWVIVLSPLAVVFYISARINSMSAASARNAFLVFSGLIGLSMSALLLRYTGASV